jgi:AhpD family alkylhydroperoxidase
LVEISGDIGIIPLGVADIPAALRPYIDAVPSTAPADKRAIHEAWLGILAHAPEHTERFLPFYFGIWRENLLGPKLTELVRLAIANTTQCPVCLLARVPAAIEAGLTEEQISYLNDLDNGGFSDRERAAIRFALNFGGDHHSIDAKQWAELNDVFTPQEVVELGLFCATFLGTGRLMKALSVIDASCAVPGSRFQNGE